MEKAFYRNSLITSSRVDSRRSVVLVVRVSLFVSLLLCKQYYGKTVQSELDNSALVMKLLEWMGNSFEINLFKFELHWQTFRLS